MARDKIIEITLEKARISLPGDARGATKRVIFVSLVCPRPRVGRVVEAKTVEFKGGVLDMTKDLWTDRVLMKELVSGRFGLRVAVSDRVAQPLDSDFLRLVGSSLLKVAGTAAHGAVADNVGADLARVPFSVLSKMVGKGKVKEPKTAASGAMDLLTDPLLEMKGAKTLKVDLEAERDFYVMPKSKGAARAKKRRRVLKKGEPCGSVTFKVEVG